MGIFEVIIGLLALVVGGFAGLGIGQNRGRKQGRKEAEGEAAQDTLKRVDKGRDAIRDGNPDKRVRDNDGKW